LIYFNDKFHFVKFIVLGTTEKVYTFHVSRTRARARARMCVCVCVCLQYVIFQSCIVRAEKFY